MKTTILSLLTLLLCPLSNAQEAGQSKYYSLSNSSIWMNTGKYVPPANYHGPVAVEENKYGIHLKDITDYISDTKDKDPTGNVTTPRTSCGRDIDISEDRIDLKDTSIYISGRSSNTKVKANVSKNGIDSYDIVTDFGCHNVISGNNRSTILTTSLNPRSDTASVKLVVPLSRKGRGLFGVRQ